MKHHLNFPDISRIIIGNFLAIGGIVLSDSNITKRALAQALKELMKTQSIEKISVRNICEQCGLNRKSFYYHFKDKYELINWIYYTEFVEHALTQNIKASWELLDEMCVYFYENRNFYNKTFQIEGQNSFSEYFFSLIFSILSMNLEEAFREEPSVDPYAEFYTDALICAIKKWISRKDCESPEKFSRFLKTAILNVSRHTYEQYDQGEFSS